MRWTQDEIEALTATVHSLQLAAQAAAAHLLACKPGAALESVDTAHTILHAQDRRLADYAATEAAK